MLDHISTLDELEKEALEIDKFLRVNCSEDASEAAERGDQLNVFMARSGKMLADAKYWQDVALTSNAILVSETYQNMPPSTKNKLIESMCQRENFMVTWIDRLNKACTHQQSFMITLISKAKAEMYLNGNTGTVRNNSGDPSW